MKVLACSLLFALCLMPIYGQNNVDAQTPEDVEAFRTLHRDDTAVLFFHNSADAKSTGFFESIFGLFGSKENLDEEFQAMIAEKYPVIEIDSKIEELQNVPDDYEVGTLPYVIAFHKGREIWREVPSKQTATIIENLIADQQQGVQFEFENGPQRTVPTVVTNEIKTQSLSETSGGASSGSRTESTGGFRSESSGSSARSDSKDGFKSETLDLVDPFDESKHYNVDSREFYDADFSHMYRPSSEGAQYGTVYTEDLGYYTEPFVETFVGPVVTTVPHVYSGESNRVIQRPRGVARETYGGVVREGLGNVVREGYGGVLREGYGGVVREGYGGVLREGYGGVVREGLGGVATTTRVVR